MNNRESYDRIRRALDGRPVAWLAKKLGYSSDDYVRQMLRGEQPSPVGLYEDIAAILNVQPRDITPTVDRWVTYPRPGARKGLVAV